MLAIVWILWCRERQQRQTHGQSIWMPPHPDYQCPHPSSPMPNALSVANLPKYPGLGQAPNDAGLHTHCPVACYNNICTSTITQHSVPRQIYITTLQQCESAITVTVLSGCGGVNMSRQWHKHVSTVVVVWTIIIINRFV